MSLPVNTESDGATFALEQFVAMRNACTDIKKDEVSRSCRCAISSLRFTNDAERLATNCMPEAVGFAPEEIAARLGAALSTAE